MKKIGIATHSYEGGALCFLEACREGARRLGAHSHPEILLSAVPLIRSLEAWERNDYGEVWRHLKLGIEQVAAAGADFFVCPDNTAHIALEEFIRTSPIPGLHIAHVVCQEIARCGWSNVGLLGTKWTMTGPVYANVLADAGMERLVPDADTRDQLNTAIFDDLCQGIFAKETVALFLGAIESLKHRGAECVILGCTEIPLIINAENSSLPILDSTRLLARCAVQIALSEDRYSQGSWIEVS